MIGWFNEKKIKRLLGIPRGIRIGLLITIGHPSDGYPVRPKVRKDTHEMASYNRY
jgi:nitroreductase